MKFDIRFLEETVSTNTDVRVAAEKGAAEGVVVWASTQTAGRGRQGRIWHSPVGNLYCSLLLRPKALFFDYGRYSFLAALAIADVVSAYLPEAKIELKWPNDVLINTKKISGILLEAGDGWLVVGVGLNLRHMPENPLYPVTSLSAEKVDVEVKEVLLKLLEGMGHWYQIIEEQGFAPIRQAWLARARRGPMRVRLPSGDLRGDFVDLDDQGNLLVQLADGTERLINTGDIFF